MKVKLLNISAGPNGVLQPGAIVEVTEAEADYLVRSNQAVSLAENASTNPVKITMAVSEPKVEHAETSHRIHARSPKKRSEVRDGD